MQSSEDAVSCLIRTLLPSFHFPDQVPEEEGYVKGLTAEEIMNLPDMPDEEDEETKGMTIGMFLL